MCFDNSVQVRVLVHQTSSVFLFTDIVMCLQYCVLTSQVCVISTNDLPRYMWIVQWDVLYLLVLHVVVTVHIMINRNSVDWIIRGSIVMVFELTLQEHVQFTHCTMH